MGKLVGAVAGLVAVWRLCWPRLLNCCVARELWTPINAPLAGRGADTAAGCVMTAGSGRRTAGATG